MSSDGGKCYTEHKLLSMSDWTMEVGKSSFLFYAFAFSKCAKTRCINDIMTMKLRKKPTHSPALGKITQEGALDIPGQGTICGGHGLQRWTPLYFPTLSCCY
jgi:hypothetical protein